MHLLGNSSAVLHWFQARKVALAPLSMRLQCYSAVGPSTALETRAEPWLASVLFSGSRSLHGLKTKEYPHCHFVLSSRAELVLSLIPALQAEHFNSFLTRGRRQLQGNVLAFHPTSSCSGAIGLFPMFIALKRIEMVRPASPTPQLDLWLSNADQVVPRTYTPTLYFYMSNGSPDFFSLDILKEALSKVLVPFYPMAGRLKTTPDGRIEINCNGEGALLAEAITDSAIDDFVDFPPNVELKQLIPKVSYSHETSSCPPLFLQVTFFKCGGVSLGVLMQHSFADGCAALNFIKTWSEVARGLDITLPPFIDRTLLQAGEIPSPKFPHIEYCTPPLLQESGLTNDNDISCSVLKVTKEQLDILRGKTKQSGNEERYSCYEMLAAHIWRCVSQARNLKEDQETKLFIAVDGRSRLRPPLPQGYFGNAIFTTTPMAHAGDLVSKPVNYAASIIHEVLVQMDDEYLRSALDYLELQPDFTTLIREPHMFKCPNINIVIFGFHNAADV